MKKKLNKKKLHILSCAVILAILFGMAWIVSAQQRTAPENPMKEPVYSSLMLSADGNALSVSSKVTSNLEKKQQQSKKDKEKENKKRQGKSKKTSSKTKGKTRQQIGQTQSS